MAVLVLILLSIVVAAVSLKVWPLALMISIFVRLVVKVWLPLVAKVLVVPLMLIIAIEGVLSRIKVSATLGSEIVKVITTLPLLLSHWVASIIPLVLLGRPVATISQVCIPILTAVGFLHWIASILRVHLFLTWILHPVVNNNSLVRLRIALFLTLWLI